MMIMMMMMMIIIIIITTTPITSLKMANMVETCSRPAT
jgi:hypothetical protein